MEHDCPICLASDLVDPLTTQCGHVFCSRCAQQALARGRACPVCRTEVTLVVPLYTGGNGRARGDLDFVRGFNQSYGSHGWREQVVLLRQYNPLVYIIPLVMVALYFVSSVDVIPDSVPVVGLLDDLFFFLATLFFFSWLADRYRRQI